jgi:hypothetical protein
LIWLVPMRVLGGAAPNRKNVPSVTGFLIFAGHPAPPMSIIIGLGKDLVLQAKAGRFYDLLSSG